MNPVKENLLKQLVQAVGESEHDKQLESHDKHCPVGILFLF